MKPGFTLVELLTATTLTVLLAGATATMLRTSTGVRRRVDRESSARLEARAAATAVVAALRNAERAPEDQTWLAGADDGTDDLPAHRLRVFTVTRRHLRPGQGQSDVVECELFRVGPLEGQPGRLMRRVDPTRNEAPDGGGILECVAENVAAFDVAYFDGLQWHAEWNGRQRGWPVAIRVGVAVLADPAAGRLTTVERLINLPHVPRPQPAQEPTQ